jgi:aminoglycoside phosphotransferase (APT) family kinase protein
VSEGTEVAAHRDLVAGLFPTLDLDPFAPIGGGWDCFTYLAHGEWIVQIPRNEVTASTLRRQIALLPELAREVWATIPDPVLTSSDPAVMVYRAIEGRSLLEVELPPNAILPERLGRFLHDLHTVPLEFVGLRGRGGEDWRRQYRDQLRGFRERVFPLLQDDERERAGAMFDRFLGEDANFRFPEALVHNDLGPAHILATPTGDLAGVIDWGDAVPGDPAMDLAWVLNHAPTIGERALSAYGGQPDATFVDRARFYDALGPWYEVVHGLDTDQPSFVASGLDGVRERLPA